MAPTRIDEPPVLEPGTEVSARFNGAFCEARVRSYSIDLRIKARDQNGEIFTIKDTNLISDLKQLKIQSTATVLHPIKKESTVVTILQIVDNSSYIVEFNDGDEKTLKRSSLHPKSGKHFDESLSLDNMPLTQPEKTPTGASLSASQSKEGSVTAASTSRQKKRSAPSPSSTSDTEESDKEAELSRRSTRSTIVPKEMPKKSGRPKREKTEKETAASSAVEKDSLEEAVAAKPRKGRPPRKASKDDSEKLEKAAASSQASSSDTAEKRPLSKRTQVARKDSEKASSTSPSRKRTMPSAKGDKEAGPSTSEKLPEKPVMKKEAVPLEEKKDKAVVEKEKKAAAVAAKVKAKKEAPSVADKGSKKSKAAEKVAAPPKVEKKESSPVIKVEPESPVKAKLVPDAEVKYPIKSVICVHQSGRKRVKWVTGLVVHPECRKKGKVDTSKELLVRLFASGLYTKVPREQTKPFSESLYSAPEAERVQKSTPDYALQYVRDGTLPPTWNASIFLPFEQHESSEDDGEGSGADPDEESRATTFMIQFIKYCDESGHPYEDAAKIDGKEVDLYKLYKEVHHSGGFGKCNQENKWPEICEELDIPTEKADAVKTIYHNFLHGGFETLYRTLATIDMGDIRIGRKRHQYTSQESTTVESPHAVPRESSVPAGSHTAPGTKRRGRPPGGTKPEQLKDRTPESIKDDQPTGSTVRVKRERSEDSPLSVSMSEESWTATRKNVAPDIPEIADPSVIKPGSLVSLMYRNKKTKKIDIYNARIMDNVADVAFYVHYANWNRRYDEWIPLQAILKVVDQSEAGAKQHIMNGPQQRRNRLKLLGPEWNPWREKIMAVLNESAASPQQTMGSQSDQASTKSGSEVRDEPVIVSVNKVKPSRKRSMSKSVDDEKEPLSKSFPEGVPEPVSRPPDEPSKTSVAPATDTERREMEKRKPNVETVLEPTSREPVSEPEKINGGSRKKKMAKPLIKESEVQVEEQEKTKLQKGPIKKVARVAKKTVADSLDRVKDIPEAATEIPEPLPSGLEPGDSSKPLSSDKTVLSARGSSAEDVSDAPRDIPPPLPENLPVEPPAPSTPAEAKAVARTPVKRGRPSNKDRKAQAVKEAAEISKPLFVKDLSPVQEVIKAPVDVEPVYVPVALDEPVNSVTVASKKPSRRKNADLLVIESGTSAAPLPMLRKEASPPSSRAPSSPARALSPGLDNLHMLASVALPSLAAEVEPPVPVDGKPVEEPELKDAVSVPDKAAGRTKKKVKKTKKTLEDGTVIILNAPGFADKHRAALERLGLPLDGSQGAGETIIEEDDFGNMRRCVVEGVELNDPDMQKMPGGPLVGAQRIEKYEQLVNDVLIVGQLLIHRLSTAYHTLRRHNDMLDGSDSKSTDEKSGASEDDAAASSAASSTRSKSSKGK